MGADLRGAITSHRARATLATKLYDDASGLGPLEVMGWLGHTHFSSTQHYLEVTPVRLMTAFHKGAKLTENLRMVGVVVDSRPGPGDPVFRYNLGHGWCTNPAYAACAYRMACANCDFYDPAENFAPTLARQADRFIRCCSSSILPTMSGPPRRTTRRLYGALSRGLPASRRRTRNSALKP